MIEIELNNVKKNFGLNNVLDGVNETLLKINDLEQLLDIYEFETVK